MSTPNDAAVSSSSPANGRCFCLLATPYGPGPIAIIQLHGDALPVLQRLTGRDDWPIGHLRLAPFADIDQGLAGRLTDQFAQLMPHGGPRVVQRLLTWLAEHHVAPVCEQEAAAWDLFPEARDEDQALILAMLARAASPLAIDFLLEAARSGDKEPTGPRTADPRRIARLNRLIEPATVVLAGPPNVGKSTLSNALLGRSMSVTAQLAGTTRDYTAGLIDLAGLVVRWYDTPGLRDTDEPVEQKAAAVAARLMQRADLLIAITDRRHDWPKLPRKPDLRVAGKSDLGPRDDADLAVSGLHRLGLRRLAVAVRDRLVAPSDLKSGRLRQLPDGPLTP